MIVKKRSKHHQDINEWIEKVIDSCQTYQQTFAVKKLINNFYILMTEQNVEILVKAELESKLELKLYDKQIQLSKK